MPPTPNRVSPPKPRRPREEALRKKYYFYFVKRQTHLSRLSIHVRIHPVSTPSAAAHQKHGALPPRAQSPRAALGGRRRLVVLSVVARSSHGAAAAAAAGVSAGVSVGHADPRARELGHAAAARGVRSARCPPAAREGRTHGGGHP